MRLLSRRNLLIGGGVATAAAFLSDKIALAQRPQAFGNATPVVVRAEPISRLSNTDPDRNRFGSLLFRSGLDLKSETSAFGGFSGLWRSAKGQDLIALADNAQFLKARIETADGRLSGLSDAIMAPLLFDNGKALRRSRYYDTESLAVSGKAVFVGVERNHAVVRFGRNKAGSPIEGVPISVPKDMKGLPSNGGLEALGVAPQLSPLAGALIGIAEGGKGFVLTGSRQGTFEVVRANGYDVTDLAFMDNGDMILLERRFSIFGGFGCRLRRVASSAIGVGARLEGDVIYESEPSHHIDNMEGLAVHREGSETVISLISDNNFNTSLQRTLLLEFALTA
ncbi:esterase-like activity of phytase family protein [Microvirga sp. 2YAF29]|uniref:esterase-like activity of phytase family protein n=1 Tax=Microvirga sp. 2YAF29 TaxID=3233031 RepID=UPI003F9662A1